MFARFVCDFLGFRAHEFPVKSEKILNIYRWLQVIYEIDTMHTY